ncbi:MAG: DUF58 domain-containing protein [Planctomycetota bacterium]
MSRIELSPGARSLGKPQRSWAEWVSWIATEDHCEWANQYVAWFRTPLGVLVVGAVSSLLCGLYVAPQGYVLLATIVAVIAIGLAWPLVAIRGVRCRFTFDTRRGREGQPCRAKLSVTNRWPWPVWGLAVNDPLLAGADETGLALARIDGWSTATFRCDLTPTVRGVYPQADVAVGTGFPFGLYQASRRAETPRRIIVWPQTFWLPPLGATQSRPHWRGAITDNRAGTEGTRFGVRDHRAGDSLRDVHWAKTARFDRLIVSERESATVEDATVVVEISPNQHTHGRQDPSLEWRLRIAASVCESFAAHHGHVDLWLGGTKLSAGRSQGDLSRLLDGVARFDPAAETQQAPKRLRDVSGVLISIAAEDETIVLRRHSPQTAASARGASQPGWIEVGSFDDVPGQVLLGWRYGKRRGRRVG